MGKRKSFLLRLPEDLLSPRGRCAGFGIGQQVPILFGDQESRCQGVHPDTHGRQVHGQPGREIGDRRFG